MAGSGSQLTTRQQRAVAALLTERTVDAAAKAAKIGPRTLYRWLADDAEFRRAVTAAEDQAIDAAARRLIGLQEAAIAVLQLTLTNRTAKDSDRLRAAEAVLEHMMKLRELRTVEARLTALEEAISANR